MVKVRARALRWESDDFPGVVEASVCDAGGLDHRIIEKVPVLTSLDITAESAFPLKFWIDAEMDSIDGGDVCVSLQHGVETVDGVRSLVVSATDVIWP